VCPTCGKALHGAGPSFAQKQEMETLQRTLADLECSQRESTRQWLTARRNERRTIVRLLAVGMLAGVLLLILQARLTSGLGLPDLVLLLLLLLAFRPLIPALPSLGTCLFRWCAPGNLALSREEQRTANARLTDLVRTSSETTLALAALQAQIAGQKRAPDEQTEAQKAEHLLEELRRAEELSEVTESTPPGMQRIQTMRRSGRRPMTDPTPRLFHGTSAASSPLAGVEQQCIQVREHAQQHAMRAEDVLPW